MIQNKIIHISFIAVLGFLIYSNSLRGEFLSDDLIFIHENTTIQNIQNIDLIWKSFNTRFVFGMSLALNYFLGGMDVFGYHLFNVIVHILNACLVYWLVLLLFEAPDLRCAYDHFHISSIAFFSAAIFLCHPIQTESVSYIFQRTSSLAALFYLGTLTCYIKARVTLHKKYFFLSIFSMLLAMFTKEMSITIPISLFVIELYFFGSHGKINWNNFKYVLPYGLFVLILPIIFIFFSSGSELVLKSKLTSHGFSFQYLLTELNVVRTYVRLLLFPVFLNHSYDYPVASGFFELRTMLSFLLLTALLGAVRIYYYKNRIVSFCIVWFFISISVESIAVCFHQKDVIFEHWLYLAVVGYSILISVLVYALIKNRTLAKVVLVLLVCILGVITYQRNAVWKNSIALWSDVCQKSSKDSLPYLNLGAAYMKKGQIDLAMSSLKKSIELDPSRADAYINVGLIHLSEERYSLAMKNFDKAILLESDHPNNALAYVNRGVLLQKLGEIKSAELDFLKAMNLRPYLLESYLNLGSLYMQNEDSVKAVNIYKKVLRLSPRQKNSLYNLTRIYLKLGEIENAQNSAIDLLRKVNDPKILTSCGSLLASYGINQLALQMFDKALKSDLAEENSYIELGKLYGNLEDFEGAVSIWEDGLKKFPQDQRFTILIEQAQKIRVELNNI